MARAPTVNFSMSFVDLCSCALGGLILQMILLVPRPPSSEIEIVPPVERRFRLEMSLPRPPSGGDYRYPITADAVRLHQLLVDGQPLRGVALPVDLASGAVSSLDGIAITVEGMETVRVGGDPSRDLKIWNATVEVPMEDDQESLKVEVILGLQSTEGLPKNLLAIRSWSLFPGASDDPSAGPAIPPSGRGAGLFPQATAGIPSEGVTVRAWASAVPFIYDSYAICGFAIASGSPMLVFPPATRSAGMFVTDAVDRDEGSRRQVERQVEGLPRSGGGRGRWQDPQSSDLTGMFSKFAAKVDSEGLTPAEIRLKWIAEVATRGDSVTSQVTLRLETVPPTNAP